MKCVHVASIDITFAAQNDITEDMNNLSVDGNVPLTTEDIYIKTLKETFGYQSFRDGQMEVIDAIMGGDSGVCLMPTGGYCVSALLKL